MVRAETDLYPPVKRFLETQGYIVRSEVHGCDVVAAKGGDLVIVEMKPAVNLTLVLQGISRLETTDAVYLAVEAPRRSNKIRWGEIRQLCRRLGLGLVTVHFVKAPWVEVICEPEPYNPRKGDKRRRFLLAEFHRRSGDHNTGGSNKRPLVTAYREDALQIALMLRENGTQKVAELRAGTGVAKTAGILQDNHYGWFERVSRGVYRLNRQGEEALLTYQDVIAAWAGGETGEGVTSERVEGRTGDTC